MAEHPAVRAILAPYDSGHRGLRMGAGPDRLMEGGLPEMLRSAGRPSLSFVPGFVPVAERDVVLAGVRAMEPCEEERLTTSDVSVVGADRLGLEGPSALEAVLDDLKSRVRRVYVHLDLDVLDPEKSGRANEFTPEGGLGAEDLKMALGLVQERFAIAAAGIASYDPAFDADGRVLAVALACVQMLTGPEKPAV